MPDLALARKVLQTEAAAVLALAERVDHRFARAVELLRDCRGRVILTGMGRDGTQGAARVVAAGGSVLAQDEASCAVWGMPRAVLEAGLTCAIMSPDKLARRVASRLGGGACK